MSRPVGLASCFAVASARSAMTVGVSSASCAAAEETQAGICVSAQSVNGIPRVDARIAAGADTFVSVTAASTPGGSASASATAHTSRR